MTSLSWVRGSAGSVKQSMDKRFIDEPAFILASCLAWFLLGVFLGYMAHG